MNISPINSNFQTKISEQLDLFLVHLPNISTAISYTKKQQHRLHVFVVPLNQTEPQVIIPLLFTIQ